MFDIRIVNLDAGSYLRMMPEKSLAKAEKENQICLDHRSTFTPMVYYADSGGLSRTKEVSRTTQLQAEAGILVNVWLCEGEDITSTSEV